jgi:ABC-type multidrug transport system fused ATPase/permease subunit
MSMNFDEKVEKTSFRLFVRGIKTLYQLLFEYRKRIYWLFALMVVVQMMHVVFPYLLKVIFDELPRVVESQTVTTKVMYLIGGLFVVKIVNDFLWHFVHMINYHNLYIAVENDLPGKAQAKLLSLSAGFHEKENTGKKVSKVEKGIDRTLWIFESLFWNFFPALFSMVFMIATLLIIDWKIGAIFAFSVVPGIVIYKKVYDKYMNWWNLWEEKKEKAVGLFCQSLINVQTVQNFGQEKREVKEHGSLRREMKEIDLKITLKMEKLFSLISITFNLGFLITIVAGLYFVFRGETTVGTLVFLIATGGSLLGNIWELMNCYTNVIRRVYAVLRMKDLFDEESDIVNSENAIVPSVFMGNFVFENVDFSYQGKERKILSDFSIQIRPNEMVALVGKSGEGKTTLVKLLCRMYDIDRGHIKLDGKDIRELEYSWYKRLVAIVKQDVEIFDGTIWQNICYAHITASAEQIEQAICAAHLKDALSDSSRFPDGLETQVGERGVKLSGGEKQRVGIARAYIALLNGARVLILDEATSNLDSEAERAIQEMINKVREKLQISIVAIAHRLATISRSDMIYVIDGGKIVEQGDHTRLLAKNGLYSRLAEFQKLGALRD